MSAVSTVVSDGPAVASAPAQLVTAEPAPYGAGDPSILGLPIFAAGSLILGLNLIGFVPAATLGAPLAVIFAATGIGLLVSTVWSILVGQTIVACVFGLFAGFWLSYAALVLGLTHGWFAIPVEDVKNTVAAFQITWAVVFTVLTLATLRLPSGFTLVFGLVVLALVLLIIGTLGETTTPGHLAGVVALAFATVGLYLFTAAASTATGGPEYPIGRPLLK